MDLHTESSDRVLQNGAALKVQNAKQQSSAFRGLKQQKNCCRPQGIQYGQQTKDTGNTRVQKKRPGFKWQNLELK